MSINKLKLKRSAVSGNYPSITSSLDLGETITPVPSAGGVAVLMRASGGAVIVITGTNFGLTAVRKLVEPTVVTNIAASLAQ